MKRTMAMFVPVLTVLAVSACGSDKQSPNVGTSPGTTIGGQQAPGPGGNNNSGNSPGGSDSAVVTTPATGSTADTQVKVGDQSPGMGSVGP
ncbi:MAG: hypothetical protein JWM12_3289 [Ilumatobacteraceae bacterium]|nr:hypothetical protein [Ilumatobacteraceae bacterium]